MAPPTAPPGKSQSNGRMEIGKPPVLPFTAFVLCEFLSLLTIYLGRGDRSVPIYVVGSIFGTFLGVLAFSWFILQDNKEQAKVYRDWGLISPRNSSKWILLAGWLFGVANIFLAAIEFSRDITGGQ
jgi:hypothetical protein